VNAQAAPPHAGSNGEQTVDVGGSYRVTRNFDVTAGVRYSQDRDRLKPTSDAKSDSQAVFVGTQFRF
jgi:opacity protein-like surface antigen